MPRHISGGAVVAALIAIAVVVWMMTEKK